MILRMNFHWETNSCHAKSNPNSNWPKKLKRSKRNSSHKSNQTKKNQQNTKSKLQIWETWTKKMKTERDFTKKNSKRPFTWSGKKNSKFSTWSKNPTNKQIPSRKSVSAVKSSMLSTKKWSSQSMKPKTSRTKWNSKKTSSTFIKSNSKKPNPK